MAKLTGNLDFDYDLAIKQGNARRLKILASRGVKPPQGSILYALKCNHPGLLQLLKDAGADPNERDGFGTTALGWAVLRDSVENIKELVRLGADPNMESHLRPLTSAVAAGKTEMVKALLEAGADSNIHERLGAAPLLEAVRHGYSEIVQLLIAAGAEPRYRGPDGKDAIAFARELGRNDLTQLFLSSLGVDKSESKPTKSASKKRRTSAR